ncbi:MAG TPA: pseudouridine-5'-phosphate glycosidase [Gemmatimonadaceae bacterium]|nr:pseudouridine-5'-phosphate glycosidase [Gemmatimonadaceae bacterium]
MPYASSVRGPVRVLAPVAAALRDGRPVVALESSVLAQGLPAPANRDAAERMVRAVSSRGAVPAITAVVRGVATAGLEDAELERFLRREGIGKVSARDLPMAMARGSDGATTVAAAIAIAAVAGIEVFSTGGIGGVHRASGGVTYDESADLGELSRTPVLVVSAGAKSILDVPATMERLETLGVSLIGYRTGEMPGFFAAETGLPLPMRAETVQEVAAMWRAHRALGRHTAMLVVQPPPADVALPRRAVDDAVETALRAAQSEGVHGGALTPFLLAAVERETGGRSLGANLALLEANAMLAADIATELSPGP